MSEALTLYFPRRAKPSSCGTARCRSRRLLDVLELLVPRVARVEPQIEQRRVALDAHEDVVEVVGDAAGQRADGLHLLRLLQLPLELLALRLGALALGDVPDHAAKARRPPRRIPDQRNRKLEVLRVAVLLDDLVVGHRRRLPRLHHLFERGLCCGRGLRGREISGVLALELGNAVAQDAAPGGR